MDKQKPLIIIAGASSGIGAGIAKHEIRICNVAPAKIKTPMLIQSNLNDEQVISVDDMAKIILWIYEQPKTLCIRDIVIAPTYYEA